MPSNPHWKGVEDRIAALLFKSCRTPLSGSLSKMTSADIISRNVYAEIKARKRKIRKKKNWEKEKPLRRGELRGSSTPVYTAFRKAQREFKSTDILIVIKSPDHIGGSIGIVKIDAIIDSTHLADFIQVVWERPAKNTMLLFKDVEKKAKEENKLPILIFQEKDANVTLAVFRLNKLNDIISACRNDRRTNLRYKLKTEGSQSIIHHLGGQSND